MNKISSHWWRIEETGSVLGIKFMVFAYRWAGQYVFRFLLFFVICFYFVMNQIGRASCRERV